MDKTEIQMPVIKAATAIGTAAVAKAEEAKSVTDHAMMAADLFTLSWSNIAAALAAAYTLSMLFEFWWKKFWRPFFERKGWIKPKIAGRLVLTEEEMKQIEIAREIRERDTIL